MIVNDGAFFESIRNPVALGIDSSSEYYCPLADNFEGPTQYAVVLALFPEWHRC